MIDRITQNRMIAEFMGGFLRDMGNGDMVWDHEHFMSPLVCKGQFELKYHELWEWLMPVVDKIESLTGTDGRGDPNYVVTIEGCYCVISVGGEEVVVERQLESKIESTYEAVLKFIENIKNK